MSFDITEQLSETKLQFRRTQIQLAFESNADEPQSNLTYLEEAYYFVPVHLALQLQLQGQYTAALDWFRTVYDYSMPTAQRKIYYGLKREDSPTATYDRAPDWLLDPLNPHEIAATRANTYTRFTLLALIRCFLEFADAEFTRDTAESLTRARTLYLTALELLELPKIKQQLSRCEELIVSLDVEINEPEWLSVWIGIKTDLTQIHNSQALTAVIDELKQILATSEPIAIRLAQARSLVARTRTTQPAPPTLARVIAEKSRRLAQSHTNLLTQPVIAQAVQKVGRLASQDYLQTVAIVSGLSTATLETEKVELPWLRQRLETATIGKGNLTRVGAILTARELSAERFANAPLIASSRTATLIKVAQFAPLRAVELVHRTGRFLPSAPAYGFCIVPNSVIEALRLRAELNLYKLRTCRNIAGVERQIEPYAAPTDAESGLPQIGAGGQLVLPGTVTFQPTPYRYTVLIERAKQLVQLAAQIESALLSALEKRDAEYFNLVKARQDARLTRAGVRLQDLRIKEAEDGVKLAELQQERAQIQVDHFQNLIEEDLIAYELLALIKLIDSIYLPDSISVSVGATGGSVSVSVSPSGKRQTEANILATLASYERRRQEWVFQQKLAEQDVRIGAQQITIAEDQVRIVGQERTIAMMQADNAEEVVNFLTNKFTNVDLYDWMSNILERVYSYFLQQATAMAKLAENQLAFERQQIPPSLIQADYWEAPTDTGLSGNMNGNAPDRRGLTGSARLLQDIFQLDQYAFDTNQRKLQLTKIISLAQLAPAEFQRFRETGVMLFATPTELFDRDFPGHYLRLIKRVRTSVIALIPPTQGIHATLTTTSISRVVLGGDVFQTGIVRRDPESVALSSPNNAIGLFELEPQSEFLFPFEGIGVDTAWEFQMPKAANLFDYNTIADVLITIEYTALNSFEYRQQIIQQLDQSISADRPFSFRNQFADQWYDLNNSELTAAPMTVRFKTVREDFPPNIESLTIQQIVLYFARAAGQSFEIPVTHLKFTEQSSTGASVGGRATSKDGIISTRRGNASSWIPIIGKFPAGEWQLSLPNTDETKQRFRDEQIEDILFVITYSGRTPEWT